MKPIHFCRCGYSGGDHPRTAQCSEGRQRVPLPVVATTEHIAALVAAAREQEQAIEAQIFKRPADNGRGDA
jgi:hypothetical protein